MGKTKKGRKEPMSRNEWHRGKTVRNALDVLGWEREDLADRLTEVTGDHWTYRMVHNLIGGNKVLTGDIVWALSRATGLPYAFFLDDPRDMLNEAKGAYLPPIRDDRTYLIPDDHPVNALVRSEWHARDTVDLTEPLQEERLPLAVGL